MVSKSKSTTSIPKVTRKPFRLLLRLGRSSFDKPLSQDLLRFAKDFTKRLEEEEGKTQEELIVANVITCCVLNSLGSSAFRIGRQAGSQAPS